MKNQLFAKQHNLGILVGAIRVQAVSAQFYVGIIQLGLVATAAIRTLQQWIPWMTFPILLGFLVLAYILAMILDYKFVIPAMTVYNNWQFYKHDNPIKTDIAKLTDILSKSQLAADSEEASKIFIGFEKTFPDIIKTDAYKSLKGKYF